MRCVEVYDLTNPTEKIQYQELLRKDAVETVKIEREEFAFTKDGNVIIVVWWDDMNTSKPTKFSLDRGDKKRAGISAGSGGKNSLQ
jgi:hypothetical protein